MAIQIVVYILYFIFAVFATQLLHEGGHILGGLMKGYDFRLLVLGPLGLRKTRDGQTRFYIEKDRTLWQGASVTLPKDLETVTAGDLKLVYMAGPLLSLLAGMAFAPYALSTNNYYAVVASVLCLSFGMASFFPFKRSAAFSDGWSIANFNRKGVFSREEVLYYRLTRTYTVDKDTADIPFDDIDELSRSKDRIRKFVALCMMYAYYKERGETPAARNTMKQLELVIRNVPRKYVRKYRGMLGISMKQVDKIKK